MIWNPNLLPPNGFEFVDADNLKHVGLSLDDLISKLSTYRARRGLPPGNPIAEVHAYLCKLYPARCLNAELAAPATAQAVGPSLGSRLAEWLRGMWARVAQKGVEFVTEDEAKRRVLICMKCPEQTKFPSECVACNETMNRISFQLRAGRDKHTSLLRVCKKYSTDLRVDALVAQSPHPDAPEQCWKR